MLSILQRQPLPTFFSFVGESKGEPKVKTAVFYYLLVKVTCHNFCHLLLVMWTNTNTSWEETTQEYEYQEVVIMGQLGNGLPQSSMQKYILWFCQLLHLLSGITTFSSHFLITTYVLVLFSPKLECSALHPAPDGLRMLTPRILSHSCSFISFDQWQCPQCISYSIGSI